MFGLSDSFLIVRGVNVKSSFVAGSELEIEDVRGWDEEALENLSIAVESDGSLRNGGREFLLPPSTKANLIDTFNAVHQNLELGPQPYTNRTSTHVHVNCMYATPQQVKTLLLLYAIFEPLAFAYVGSERKENIHCMPLNSTHMPNLYNHGNLESLREKWHKYTALNILPLNELGTVEFRHLGGTSDEKYFTEWVNFLETLWTSAMNIGQLLPTHLTDLTTLKDIQRKLTTVAFVEQCKERPTYILEDNLLDVKLSFI
jgi:hypothetical protein